MKKAGRCRYDYGEFLLGFQVGALVFMLMMYGMMLG